jgi:valyl-tRNA synthetase
VTPMDLLDEYSADAVRYWAASGRPGADTAFDIGQMKIGRRLAIKLLNASKFILGEGTEDATITNAVDQALIATLADTVQQATAAFEEYNYARALEISETFFWNFTDDFIELVKDRFYGGQGEQAQGSARATLLLTLRTMLGLFAPFLPFTTEEVWSWWQTGSVHRSTWPDAADIRAHAPTGDSQLMVDIAGALSGIRKVKSDAKVSMRAALATATISADADTIRRLEHARTDLAATGSIQDLVLTSDGSSAIEVRATLAEAAN